MNKIVYMYKDIKNDNVIYVSSSFGGIALGFITKEIAKNYTSRVDDILRGIVVPLSLTLTKISNLTILRCSYEKPKND